MNSTILLRIFATGLVIFQIARIYIVPGAGVGGHYEWQDGATTISAVSSPMALVWAVLGTLLFVTLMTLRLSTVDVGVPSWSRRVTAFLIDFHFAGATLAGVSAMVDLLVEATRTGDFAWHFERHYAVATDLFAIPLTLIYLAVLFLYFCFPLTRGRQTVGCFLMRTMVTPPFGGEGCFTWLTAARRTWYEFRGIFRWTSLLRPKRDAEGNTWYDVESGCHVVLVEYGSSA